MNSFLPNCAQIGDIILDGDLIFVYTSNGWDIFYSGEPVLMKTLKKLKKYNEKYAIKIPELNVFVDFKNMIYNNENIYGLLKIKDGFFYTKPQYSNSYSRLNDDVSEILMKYYKRYLFNNKMIKLLKES